MQDLKTNFTECYQIARDNICKAQHRQKLYDTKLYQNTYNSGDVVLRLDSATKVCQS